MGIVNDNTAINQELNVSLMEEEDGEEEAWGRRNLSPKFNTCAASRVAGLICFLPSYHCRAIKYKMAGSIYI